MTEIISNINKMNNHQELMSNSEWGDTCSGAGAGATVGGAIGGPIGAGIGAVVGGVIGYEIGEHNQ